MNLCKCGCGTVVETNFVSGHNRRKVSSNNIQTIKKMYLEDLMSIKEIANSLKLGATTISRYVRKLGISRSLSDAQKVAAQKGKNWMKTQLGRKLHSMKMKGHSHNRIYEYDRAFFSKLNRKSAYVLGFFIADGCLKGNRIIFSSKDKDVLEKISSVIGNKRPVFRHGYYHLVYYSHQMVHDLNGLGIVERKTFRLKPIDLAEDLINHFIRGFFDGDGGVSRNIANGQIVSYIDCSSFKFLKWIKSLLPLESGVIAKRSNTNCFELRLSTKDSKILYKFLYSNLQQDDLSLKRKKVKFDTLIGGKNMKGVILAGGLGTRLRPLTLVTNKQGS